MQPATKSHATKSPSFARVCDRIFMRFFCSMRQNFIMNMFQNVACRMRQICLVACLQPWFAHFMLQCSTNNNKKLDSFVKLKRSNAKLSRLVHLRKKFQHSKVPKSTRRKSGAQTKATKSHVACYKIACDMRLCILRLRRP